MWCGHETLLVLVVILFGLRAAGGRWGPLGAAGGRWGPLGAAGGSWGQLGAAGGRWGHDLIGPAPGPPIAATRNMNRLASPHNSRFPHNTIVIRYREKGGRGAVLKDKETNGF